MKAKTVFYCTECGNETPKWSGQCPACRAWNTLVEQPAETKKKTSSVLSASSAGQRRTMGALNRPRPISEVSSTHELRFETGMSELERVTVGIRSFFSVYGSGLNRLFLLKDCPKLKELKIGSWSFPSYSACVIESVPSLETIEIGDMDEESYNFDCATLQLRGKWLLVQ